MAAHCARRTLLNPSASASATTLLSGSIRSSSSSFASAATMLRGLASAKPTSASRFSLQKLKISRLPVELGGALSLMPLHSVTASALSTSLLSLKANTWGCLSEGFATTL